MLSYNTTPLPIYEGLCWGTNKILVGTVVKEKLGDLEEDFREVFIRHLGNEFTGVVVGVIGKKRLLVRFQYGFEKDLILNKPTVVTVERIPNTNKYELAMIPERNFGIIGVYKGLYQEVYVSL